MYSIDLLRQISYSLWSHKIRTCAALFGIIWGTITVILLLALSNGFYEKSIKNLAFINNGTIFAWGGVTSKPYAGLPQGQRIHLQLKDVLEIVQDIPGIQWFSPVYHLNKETQYQNKNVNASIEAVADGYDKTMQLRILPGGRFIDVLDIQNKNHVVFLDDVLKKILFGKEEAVGKIVTIQGLPFTVIGVADPDNDSAVNFRWGENNAYIPYTTYLGIFGQQDISMIFLTPQSAADTPRIKRNLKNILAMKFHYDPSDEDAFRIPNLEDDQIFFTWFFRVIELFLLFCGTLTLSVGGLGTANMMFLIVTERTREIGLRMALGAEQSHIMLQFILETLTLVSLGGFIGALISGILLTILKHAHLPDWLGTPHISSMTVLMTVLVLVMVGLIAGYFPARRAANMEPVRALAF